MEVSRSGARGSVRVIGGELVEGRSEGEGTKLKVRRAPVYLGGAPPKSRHLPPAELYKTGHVLRFYTWR